MMGFLALLVMLLVVLVALATLVLLVEIGAAFLGKEKFHPLDTGSIRPSIAVLVPAHNESSGLLPTLSDILSQMRRGDRLLVVADNCTDDTADVAEALGVEVVNRRDPERPGKGYALDFGLRHLNDNIPAVVIMLDADCRLDAEAIDRLARTCLSTGRPVQALYLMKSADGSGIIRRVAEFAWRVKNSLRPRGLAVIGLPCQLMGSGMAFPRETVGLANFATSHLAEDLHIGLQLAFSGYPPIFCPTAVVRSEFPVSVQGAAVQRQRWEQGHLRVIFTEALPFVWESVVTRNWRLFALALDAAVPPLTLLGFLIFGIVLASCAFEFLGGTSAPFIVSSLTLLLFVGGLVVAWLKCGRDLLPARALLSMFPYVMSKLPVYARIVISRGTAKWERTDRNRPH